MAKDRWKSFSNHIDAEKIKLPETLQYNWRMWDSALSPKRLQFKAQLPLSPQRFPQPPGFFWYTDQCQLIRKIEDQVKKILKLTKNINHGNKERNLRKKSEVIHLIEDFQKQYEVLYSMYQDLREEVKKSVNGGGEYGDEYDDDTSSDTDSDTFYAPEDRISTNQKSETSSTGNYSTSDDLEDHTTILKDKLTSSTEVKTIVNLDHMKPDQEYCEEGNFVNISKNLAQINDLEGEVASLKEKISRMEEESRENEGRFCSLEKQFEENEQEYLSRISDLMARANDMQIEVNTLKQQKYELEEHLSYRVEGLTKERAKLEMELKRKSECLLQTQVLINEVTLNLQRISEENEGLNVEKQKLHGEISELRKSLSATKNELSNEQNKFNNYQNNTSVKIKSSEEEIKNLNKKLEILRNDRKQLQTELEENKGLRVKVNSLELDIQSVNVQKQNLHGEISELQKSLSATKNELWNEQNKFNTYHDNMSVKIKSSEEEIKSLNSKVESLQSVNVEKQKLHEEISDLQKSLSATKNELMNKLMNEQNKFSTYQNNTSVKIKSSEEEIENLNNKLEILQNNRKQLQTELEKISKSNFQIIERKAEEMAEEFRKQFEDKYRILSRRIRVAEQLQVENKEWYRKTKETYEQISNDLKERAEKSEIGLKNVKDMALTANDVLISLDAVALRFEERAANFMNRISKASCELKFAKDWATRKNKALVHVKDDLECVLRQLDDKEAEILVFREKVWKSENKVRELEKMIKEREDGMLVMEEEKREAIRQLCVWIDYHRSRSDYYKKMLSEINARKRN